MDEKNYPDAAWLEGMTGDEIRDRLCVLLIPAAKKDVYEKMDALVRDFHGYPAAVRILVSQNEEAVCSILVSAELLMDRTGMKSDELFEAALQNTETLFPVVNDSSVISYFDRISGGMVDTSDCMDIHMLMTGKAFGASAIMYKDVLKNLSDRLGGDLWLLPSSIHEWVVIPNASTGSEDAEFTWQQMAGLVKVVNREKVAPDEVLGEDPLYYRKEDNTILTKEELLSA